MGPMPPAPNNAAAASGPASNLLFESAMEAWLRAHPHMHMLGRSKLSHLSQLSGAMKEKERRERRRRARNAGSAAPSGANDSGRRRFTAWGRTKKKKSGRSGKAASGDRKNGGATASPTNRGKAGGDEGGDEDDGDDGDDEEEEKFGAGPKERSSPNFAAPPPPPSEADDAPLERVLRRIEMRRGAAAYTRQYGLSGAREIAREYSDRGMGGVPGKLPLPPDPRSVDEEGVLILPADRKKQLKTQVNVLMESMQRAGGSVVIDEALAPPPRVRPSSGQSLQIGSRLARGLGGGAPDAQPPSSMSGYGEEGYMTPRDRTEHVVENLGDLLESMEKVAGRAVID